MFDWQTEEDWDDFQEVVEQPRSKVSPRAWTFLFFTMLALGLGGFSIYYLTNTRIEEATDFVQDDVLSSHFLVRQAQLQADPELFTTVLSGRDPEWTNDIQALFTEGELVNRPSMSLIALEESNKVLDVQISPDLKEAVVQLDQTYQVGTNEVFTLSLMQTEVYRHGSQRWLLAPPEEEFWGEVVQYDGEYVTITYPERDRVFVEALGDVVDEWLEKMCTETAGIACPTNYHFYLTLESDLGSFRTFANARSLVFAGNQLELPTLTLLGVPLDEAGETYMQNIYVERVLRAALGERARYECCRHSAFYNVLLQLQLETLGFTASPSLPEETANGRLGIRNLKDTVGSLSSAWLSPYPIVDTNHDIRHIILFGLQQKPDLTLAVLQDTLDDTGSLFRWVSIFLEERVDIATSNEIEQAWFEFLQKERVVSTGVPPSPLPDQNIQLVCSANTQDWGGTQLIYEVDIATETTLQQGVLQGFIWRALPAPNGEGMIVNWNGPNDRVPFLVRMDKGDLHLLYQAEGGNYQILAERFDPTGRYLFAQLFHPQGNREIEKLVLDLEQCESGGCQNWAINGFPYWSPNGEQAVVMSESGELWLTNVTVLDGELLTDIPVGVGMVSWLDNDTFLVTQIGGQGIESPIAQLQMYRYSLSTRELQAYDVPALLDESGELIPYTTVASIQTVTGQPNLLAFVLMNASLISSRFGENFTVALLDLETFTWQVLLHDVGSNLFYSSMVVSPNGEWLSVRYSDGDKQQFLLFYNTITKETKRLVLGNSEDTFTFSSPWSADGKWFVHNTDRVLNLYAPDSDYTHHILHGVSDCYEVVWVD